MPNAVTTDAAAGILRIDPGFVLPRRALLRDVHDERDRLLNRLVELRVILPDAEQMEMTKLRDYVQWQEERAEHHAKAALLRPAHQPKKLSREQVITGLREYHEYRKARREGRRRLYQGGGAADASAS